MEEKLVNAPAEVDAAWHRLNPKQQALALAVPLAKTPVDAARQAGYSENTALKKAGAMVNQPDVALVVKYLVGQHVSVATEAMQETVDEVERIAKELGHIAFCDPLGIFGPDDVVLPVREWPEELRRNLAGVEVLEQYAGRGKDRVFIGYLKKFKFCNKVAALESLAKLRQLGGYATVKDQPAGNTVNVFGGVVVLPPKDSGRGREVTGGIVIDGELGEGATVRRQLAHEGAGAPA